MKAAAGRASGGWGRPWAAAVLLGAGTWAAWLGWDRSASFDVVTGTVQDPYVTLQVVGCAVTLAVVVAVLAGRRSPVPATVGTGVGFWLPWTITAVWQDDSGLALIGAVLLPLGMLPGLVLAAVVGLYVGDAVRWRRRRRERRRTAVPPQRHR